MTPFSFAWSFWRPEKQVDLGVADPSHVTRHAASTHRHQVLDNPHPKTTSFLFP